jgi:transposase InsO family protein
MRAFENTWLCRYPKPMTVISDRGPEFLGHEFPSKLLEAGIKFKPITALNPQSNGIIERVHQTIAQILRVMIDQRKPKTSDDCNTLVEDGLATAMHATRAAAHSQLDFCSPGSIAFSRDMILNIPYHADLLALQSKRQQKINLRLLRANAHRKFIDYQPGMKVYILSARKSKLDPIYKGPYEVVSTHTNGTVTVRLRDDVTDRINIRRLKPA